MPPRTVKAPPRAKRAKAEVQQEFDEIQAQVESAREAADPKAEETARLRETEIRHAVESVTVEAQKTHKPACGMVGILYLVLLLNPSLRTVVAESS